MRDRLELRAQHPVAQCLIRRLMVPRVYFARGLSFLVRKGYLRPPRDTDFRTLPWRGFQRSKSLTEVKDATTTSGASAASATGLERKARRLACTGGGDDSRRTVAPDGIPERQLSGTARRGEIRHPVQSASRLLDHLAGHRLIACAAVGNVDEPLEYAGLAIATDNDQMGPTPSPGSYRKIEVEIEGAHAVHGAVTPYPASRSVEVDVGTPRHGPRRARAHARAVHRGHRATGRSAKGIVAGEHATSASRVRCRDMGY